MFQLLLTAGILLGYLISLAFHTASPDWNWRAMFLFALIPGTILLIGSFFLPESPHWYFLKGFKEKAEASLTRTRSPEEAKLEMEELIELKESKAKEAAKRKSGKERVWKSYYLFPLLLSLGIIILVQLTGINNYLQYSTVILQRAGLTGSFVMIMGAVGFGIVNFVTTIFALSLVDKLGRRPLLMIGSGGIVISLAFTGIVSLVLETGTLEGSLVMVGLLLFLISFAIGPGVCIWLAASELLPLPIRSKGMAVNLLFASLVPALYSWLFLHLVNWITLGGVFLLSGGLTFFLFLIARFLLPETKGKTLEEIEKHFQRRSAKSGAEA